MLVGKGQLLDLRVVKFAQQAVEIYAESMCSQLAVKVCILSTDCRGRTGLRHPVRRVLSVG